MMNYKEEEQSFIAVFFDVDLPMLPEEARYIRISKQKYNNLMDENIPDKTIELLDSKIGLVGTYSIVSRRVFYLKNSIDNTIFLIVDIKKIK